MARIHGFIADCRTAIDSGLPVTAEDIVEGLVRAAEERGIDPARSMRYDLGIDRVLARARKRQSELAKDPWAILGNARK